MLWTLCTTLEKVGACSYGLVKTQYVYLCTSMELQKVKVFFHKTLYSYNLS